MTIAEEDSRLSKGENFVHRVGIYSTPELGMTKLYATKFEYAGEKYGKICQNRMNPKYIQVVSKAEMIAMVTCQT